MNLFHAINSITKQLSSLLNLLTQGAFKGEL